MGVKGNNHILPQPIRLDIRENRMKYIIIDAMPIICRWSIGSYNTGKYIIDKQGKHITETYIIFKLAIRFLKESVIPIFVFDTSIPDNKSRTIEKRKILKNKANTKISEIINNTSNIYEKKQPIFTTNEEYTNYLKYIKRSYNMDRYNINLAKFLLQWMGLPVVNAPVEADSQCAAIASMYNNNVIGVLSDDFDPIMHMSINIIKISSINSNYFDKYSLTHILNHIEDKINNIVKTSNDVIIKNKYKTKVRFTHDNLIDIGCLMGTDYCSSLRYDKKQKTKNIDNLLELYLKYDMNISVLLSSIKKIYNISNTYISNVLKAINIYKNAEIISPQNIDLRFNRPNINMIRYICNDFIESNTLNDSIHILNNAYNNHFRMSTNITSNNKCDDSKLLNNDLYNLPEPKYYTDIATIFI